MAAAIVPAATPKAAPTAAPPAEIAPAKLAPAITAAPAPQVNTPIAAIATTKLELKST